MSQLDIGDVEVDDHDPVPTTPRNLLWRRVRILPLSLVIIITLTFGLVELMPGDPALVIAGEFGGGERAAEIRADLGLDRSLPERYVAYWRDLLRGDLGSSLYSGVAVTTELRKLIPRTLELVIPAIVLAVVLGLVSGAVAASRRSSPVDRVVRGIVTVSQSIPEFLFGLLLILVVFYYWSLAPAPVGQLPVGVQRPPQVTGFMTVDAALAGHWSLIPTLLHQMMLPVFSLTFHYYAAFAKLSRSVMGEALASPYVSFAKASGMGPLQVFRYGFATARTPIITYVAILLAQVLGGVAIAELVFSWGGFGQWGLQGVFDLDLPVIQAFVLVIGMTTLVSYTVLDIVVAVLDPRIRLAD